MVKRNPINYERKLRRQLKAFLNEKGPHRAILSALDKARKRDWRLFLFGGVLRDVLILGLKHKPRDIDVVIMNGTSSELADALQPYIKRRTRFGGFQLELNRWNFDIWPLHTTWAFVHNKHLLPTPDNLPKTTFLNVEAVAVSVDPCGDVGEIVESGFFEAVKKRTLDINLEENPYPALAAVRAMATATSLRYSLSPRLARYILEMEEDLGADALVAAQDSHYGLVRFRRRDIRSLVKHIDHELRRSPRASLLLPQGGEQLTLWAPKDKLSVMPALRESA
jgi:hypothetical protein